MYIAKVMYTLRYGKEINYTKIHREEHNRQEEHKTNALISHRKTAGAIYVYSTDETNILLGDYLRRYHCFHSLDIETPIRYSNDL